MPSAEGHVGYPRDLIDLDDDALTKLAGLRLATAVQHIGDGNGNGNGHHGRRKTSSDVLTGDLSDG
jgi:hypothetical protein